MKSRLPIFLSLLGLIGGTLIYFAFSDYVIQKAKPNEIEGSVATTNEPVCYIGEQEFVTLDRALKYAYEDDAANDIYVYVGQNPSIDEEHTIASNDALYITYCDVKGESGSSLLKNEELGIRKWGSGTSTNDISGFSCSSKVTLNADLKVEGQIKIGAVVSTSSLPYQGFIQGEYAALDINGHTLTIKDGGIVYANGVLDDSASTKGEVDVESGGKIYTDFGVEDFRGGTCTQNKYYNDETPFLLYKLPYLFATTKINYGGGLYGNCVLYALSSFNFIEEPLIAPSGLIEPQSGYVTHANEDSSIDGYKERIDIYGDIKTNALTMSYSFVSISIANVHFPISKYLDFNAYGDSTMSIGTKLKVLPGSAINLYGSSSLNVGAEVSLYQTFKAQSEFSSYSNYTFYPDYGTYDPAYIKLNGASSLAIDSSVSAGLSGRVIFDTSDACLEELASDIKTSSDVAYSITTSEGIGYPSYVKLYDYINYLDVYQVDGSVAKCLYKRFSNYYFEYLYDSDNSTVLTEIDMKTLNGTTIAKKEDISSSEEATWQILTPELEFITSDETADYIDDAIIIDAVDADGNTTSMAYVYDGSKEYWISDSSKAIISYAGNNIVVSVYDESKRIYTDGENYYVEFDGVFAKVSLYENDYILKNSDSSSYYFYDTEDSFYGSSDGWILINTYTPALHYFRIKVSNDTYKTSGLYSSNWHTYIIVNGKRQIIYNMIKSKVTTNKSPSFLILPYIGYSESSDPQPSYAYIGGEWQAIDGTNDDYNICYATDASTSETNYYAFLPSESQYVAIEEFTVNSETSFCYVSLMDSTIVSSIEYDYVFYVTEYTDYLDKEKYRSQYWALGRIIDDGGVSKMVYYSSNASKEIKCLPIEKNDAFIFLGYTYGDILENLSSNSEERFVYDNTPFTSSSNVYTSKYATMTDSTIAIGDYNVCVYEDSEQTYVAGDSGLIAGLSDSYYGFFADGRMYVANINFDIFKYGGGYFIAQNKLNENITLSEHQNYSGLYYGSFTYDGTNYLLYAAVVSGIDSTSYSYGYASDDSVDSIIEDATDDEGNTAHTINFYTSKTKYVTYTLTEK